MPNNLISDNSDNYLQHEELLIRLLHQLLDQLKQNEELWPMKTVARHLSCSERTLRRIFDNDPKFPKPLPAKTYKDKGRLRTTQRRWNPDDIRAYHKKRISGN